VAASERLVPANALTPTIGTVAAATGGAVTVALTAAAGSGVRSHAAALTVAALGASSGSHTS
jgi:hypothetical protein